MMMMMMMIDRIDDQKIKIISFCLNGGACCSKTDKLYVAMKTVQKIFIYTYMNSS